MHMQRVVRVKPLADYNQPQEEKDEDMVYEMSQEIDSRNRGVR